MNTDFTPQKGLTEKASKDPALLRGELLTLYRLMDTALGDLHWWPALTREEVIIGAILVQNVSWANAVKAIDRLREPRLLHFGAIYHASLEILEACIVSTRVIFRMQRPFSINTTPC